MAGIEDVWLRCNEKGAGQWPAPEFSILTSRIAFLLGETGHGLEVYFVNRISGIAGIAPEMGLDKHFSKTGIGGAD